MFSSYSELRRAVLGASARTSWWRRHLFYPRVAVIVHEAKTTYKSDFARTLANHELFVALLREGYFEVYLHSLVPELPVGTPGHIAASCALLAFLLDRLDHGPPLPYSPEGLLDALALPLWHKICLAKMGMNYQQLLNTMRHFHHSLPPLGALLPRLNVLPEDPEPQESQEMGHVGPAGHLSESELD